MAKQVNLPLLAAQSPGSAVQDPWGSLPSGVRAATTGDNLPEGERQRHHDALLSWGLPIVLTGLAYALGSRTKQGPEAAAAFLAGHLKGARSAAEFAAQQEIERQRVEIAKRQLAAQERGQRFGMLQTVFGALTPESQQANLGLMAREVGASLAPGAEVVNPQKQAEAVRTRQMLTTMGMDVIRAGKTHAELDTGVGFLVRGNPGFEAEIRAIGATMHAALDSKDAVSAAQAEQFKKAKTPQEMFSTLYAMNPELAMHGFPALLGTLAQQEPRVRGRTGTIDDFRGLPVAAYPGEIAAQIQVCGGDVTKLDPSVKALIQFNFGKDAARKEQFIRDATMQIITKARDSANLPGTPGYRTWERWNDATERPGLVEELRLQMEDLFAPGVGGVGQYGMPGSTQWDRLLNSGLTRGWTPGPIEGLAPEDSLGPVDNPIGDRIMATKKK